jgi:2-oxoglutarate dehydrogenase E2 component (dihydrolipoamide succinyltransferase)
VINIIKPTGSYVKNEEEILELETEKVNQVIHAPAGGELHLDVKIDDIVKIGQIIGYIETETKATAKEKTSISPKKEKIETQPPSPTPKEEKKPPSPAAEEAFAARRMPEEFAAELQEVKQAEPQSKITEEKQTRQRMSGLRKTIAKRLVEVKNQTAMLTTFNEVDMSAVIAIRTKERENFEKRYGVRLGFMSFFVKACVSALKAFPTVNAFIEGEYIIYNHFYHIGVAVSTERGLMVPVLRDAEQLSYAEIEKHIALYAKEAREGHISVDRMKGGTFTITNGGIFGSLLSTPILNPPQSAILGMHTITPRPVAVENQILIRPMMYLALSYDHRIIDGKESVQFLMHVKENLEDPAKQLIYE